MNRRPLEGVFTLLPTVFSEEGDLDLEGFKENIRYLEGVGMHGVVVMSGVGEFYALDSEEFKKVASVARESCTEMICVINCAYQDVREAAIRARYAESIGADYAMIYSYHYHQWPLPNQEDQYYTYVRLIHDATREIEFIIYNNPREANGFDISVGLYSRLLESLDRIAACTEDITNVNQLAVAAMSAKIWNVGKSINVLAGDEAGMFPMMFYGGQGCLATYGLAMPEFLLNLYNECKKGNWDVALQGYQDLTRYPWVTGEVGINIKGKPSSLFPGTVTTPIGNTHVVLGRKHGTIFPGTVTSCKAMAEAAGRTVGNPRLPMLPPAQGMREFARGWLADIAK